MGRRGFSSCRLLRVAVSYEFDGEVQPATLNLADARMMGFELLKPMEEVGALSFDATQDVVSLEDVQDRIRPGGTGCVARERRRMPSRSERIHDLRLPDDHRDRQSVRHRFAGGHEIGPDAGVFDRPHLSGAAHARLHLVHHEQKLVRMSQCGQALQVAGGRYDVAATRLERFDDHRGHVRDPVGGIAERRLLAFELAFQHVYAIEVAVRVRLVVRASVAIREGESMNGRVGGGDGPLVGGHERLAGQSHGACRSAVVVGILGQDHCLSRVPPGKFGGDLDGFSAGHGVQHLGIAAAVRVSSGRRKRKGKQSGGGVSEDGQRARRRRGERARSPHHQHHCRSRRHCEAERSRW